MNWQAKLDTVQKRNKYMFDHRELISDVTFALSDSNEPSLKITVPAHKYVLATGSTVFFAMFYGEMAEQRESIELDDCDVDSFTELLRYIYCDEVNLSKGCVLSVWYLAHKYDIPSLADMCEKFLEEEIDTSNVLDILPHARLFQAVDLETICWEIVDFETEKVLKKDAFVEIAPDTLQSLLQRESLTCEEIEIFLAVNRLAEHKCRESGKDPSEGHNKREVLGEAIFNLVRFPNIPQQKIAELVLPTEMLTKDEIVALFKHFNAVAAPDLRFSTTPRKSIPVKSCKIFDAVRYQICDGETHKVSFSVSKPVKVCGVRLYGGQGCTYNATVSLTKAGNDSKALRSSTGDFQTNSVENEMSYGFSIFFCRPISLEENVSYNISGSIIGPNCHQGSQEARTMCMFELGKVSSFRQLAQILYCS